MTELRFSSILFSEKFLAVWPLSDIDFLFQTAFHNLSEQTHRREIMFKRYFFTSMLLFFCVLVFSGTAFTGEDKYFKMVLKSAELDDAEAQFKLGNWYYNGLYVRQDYNDAIKWYKKAAENGHTEAQFSLAIMYDLGKAGMQDYKKAYVWYRLASARGHEDAKSELAVLEPKMSSSQITEAQKEAELLWKKIRKK